MAQPLDDAGLDTIFRTARTYNGYTDAPVTEADIRRIYDLVKMGPTSANQQSARFVWVTSQEAKDKLAALASGTNAPKIAGGARHRDHRAWTWRSTSISPGSSRMRRPQRTGSRIPTVRYTHAFRNSSLQGAYFIIAARALGFDTGPMSGFDNASGRRGLLRRPAEREVELHLDARPWRSGDDLRSPAPPRIRAVQYRHLTLAVN
jgi:3-hydroxypropanoate dehydrogenase